MQSVLLTKMDEYHQVHVELVREREIPLQSNLWQCLTRRTQSLASSLRQLRQFRQKCEIPIIPIKIQKSKGISGISPISKSIT